MTGLRDVVLLMTDQERAAPPYESPELAEWRTRVLAGRRWFEENGVSFALHYTGSLACVPSRPTMFTGHYPDVHGVTQTDGLGKDADDSGMRWLRKGEVPTLGHWFRAAGFDTHYIGKWHLTHADLHTDDGTVLATNDDDGVVDDEAVAAYINADVLDDFGFSGWIGPEPHGGTMANSGLRRDGTYASRAVAWLDDLYSRRTAGEEEAQRPFLLVVSFVNPHDIVLFPVWSRNDPLLHDPFGTPPVPAPPTADEDLADKPASQRAYRDHYTTGYAPLADDVYTTRASEYRQLYYRLHAEVDEPLDRVRQAVMRGASISQPAVVARTSDHGELLGAHGGLHQKWFNLYDEATRVPFVVALAGQAGATLSPRRIDTMVTSHVDVLPTLIGLAGIDSSAAGAILRPSFTEFHELPGRDLSEIIQGSTEPDADRSVYLMTRDHILDGDSGASVVARALGLKDNPPENMRVVAPCDVASNFEAIVAWHDDHRWKLVRTFDDPDVWLSPAIRADRSEPLADEWELYDLTIDPIESTNLWTHPGAESTGVAMQTLLDEQRRELVPMRNNPWPYPRRGQVDD